MSDSNGEAVIGYEVETNSLPDHCYYQETNAPIGAQDDYDEYYYGGVFNRPVKEMYTYDVEQTKVDGGFYYTKLNSQTDIDSQLCDNTWAKYQYLDDADTDYYEGGFGESSN
jgi:hypothetical protein